MLKVHEKNFPHDFQCDYLLSIYICNIEHVKNNLMFHIVFVSRPESRKQNVFGSRYSFDRERHSRVPGAGHGHKKGKVVVIERSFTTKNRYNVSNMVISYFPKFILAPLIFPFNTLNILTRLKVTVNLKINAWSRSLKDTLYYWCIEYN